MTSTWKKTTFFALLCIIILFAVVWFRLLPNIRSIAQNNKAIAAKESELRSINEKISSLKNSKSDSAEINSAYDTVNKLWPDKEEVSGFIVEIEGLAAKKGLILNSLSVTEKPTAKATKSADDEDKKADSKTSATDNKKDSDSGISFNFDTSGSYSVIKEFIADLEKLSRYNTVTTVNLNSNSSDKNVINLKINGYIYAK